MFRGLTRGEHLVVMVLVAALTGAATAYWLRGNSGKHAVVIEGPIERGGLPGDSRLGSGDDQDGSLLPPAVETIPASMFWDGRLDLNMADANALRTLPGIDSGMAEAIVRHRRNFGPFHAVEDLADVEGIAPDVVAALVPQLAATLSKERESSLDSMFPPEADSTIVNLNAATLEQLMTLEDIGPERAKGIIELRTERRGRFLRVDEILAVDGIGPVTLEKNRHRLAVR